MSNRSLSAMLVQSTMLRTKLNRARPAPSVFYYPGLSSVHPLWTNYFKENHMGLLSKLEDNFEAIRDEYMNMHFRQKTEDSTTGSDYIDEHKNFLHTGDWDWMSYVLKGKKQSSFAEKCPITASVLDSTSRLMTGTPLSFAFFSTMGPGAQIKPHFGPCNLRIRVHFPLVVPSGDVGMKIGNEIVRWEAGKPLLFDDSYEHEVWNRSSGDRVILLFDLWHPELEESEIASIQEMFAFAEEQGWGSKRSGA